MGQVKLEVLIKALVLNLFSIPGISRGPGSQMSNLSTTDHRETLSVGELAWTCVDEVQHYYSCDQDLIVFNNYRAESYFTFIADCCNRSPYVQTPSRTFYQVATKHHLL